MASKKESTFVNMVLVLFLVAAIAAATLAFVYQATKGPIEAAKLKKKKEAIGKVVPKFENDPIEDMYKAAIGGGDSLEVYPANDKSGNPVGYAVRANTKKGFSGEFWIMVGFKADGTIHNTSVLEHKETPGLGDKMEKKKADWSNKVNGMDPASGKVKIKQDGGEIDAITASTITSRAFCDAIDRAYQAYQNKK